MVLRTTYGMIDAEGKLKEQPTKPKAEAEQQTAPSEDLW